MSFRGKKRSYPSTYNSSSSQGCSSFSKHSKFSSVQQSGLKTNNTASKKKCYVYTVQLRDDFWYVGTTIDPTSRLDAHRSGKGSEWTRQHPPLEGCSYSLKEVKGDEEQARLDEDSEVKRLMKEHGIEKVRGGSYSTTILSRSDVKALSKELRHASGGCLRCGHKSHWATSCYAGKDVAGNDISDDERDDHKHFKSSTHRHNTITYHQSPVKYKQANPKTTNDSKEETCHRCGRTGHWVKDCYAKIDIEGHAIASPTKPISKQNYDSPSKINNSIDDDFCRRCGRRGHWMKDCFAKVDQNGQSLNSPAKQSFPKKNTGNEMKKIEADVKCVRCGRKGHLSNTCFAKTHLNGKIL